MARRTDVLEETLDLLILKALALGPRLGLSISRRIDLANVFSRTIWCNVR